MLNSGKETIPVPALSVVIEPGYLVIPPSDISRTKPLVRLVLNQIGRRLTERLEGEAGKKHRFQLLMMLDELLGFFSKEFDDQRDGALIRRLEAAEILREM